MQFVVTGVTIGAVYGISALAITLIFRVSGVINIAQGEFITLGALGTVWLTKEQGLSMGLAALLSVAAVGLLGFVFSVTTIVPAQRHGLSVLGGALLTLGLAIVGQGIAFQLFGRDLRSASPLISGGPLRWAGAVISVQAVVLLGVTLVLAGLMVVFFRSTLVGKAMTAASDNALGARAVGIDVRRMTALAFTLAAVLGALAGFLLVPIRVFDYLTGFGLAMRGVAAAALVGLRSPGRALVAGLGIGVLEALVSGYLSSAFQPVIVFSVLIGVLLAWPQLVPQAERAH